MFYAQFAAVVLSIFFVMVLFLWLCYRHVYNQTVKQIKERMRDQPSIRFDIPPDASAKEVSDAVVAALLSYNKRTGKPPPFCGDLFGPYK